MVVNFDGMLLAQKPSKDGKKVYMTFIDKESGGQFQISSSVRLEDKAVFAPLHFVMSGALRSSFRDGRSSTYFSADMITAENPGGKGGK